MKTSTIMTYVALFVVIFMLGSLAVIWSLNALFPLLAIQYSWQSCVAVVTLVGAVRGYKGHK